MILPFHQRLRWHAVVEFKCIFAQLLAHFSSNENVITMLLHYRYLYVVLSLLVACLWRHLTIIRNKVFHCFGLCCHFSLCVFIVLALIIVCWVLWLGLYLGCGKCKLLILEGWCKWYRLVTVCEHNYFVYSKVNYVFMNSCNKM